MEYVEWTRLLCYKYLFQQNETIPKLFPKYGDTLKITFVGFQGNGFPYDH